MERELIRIPVVARDELAPESVPYLPAPDGEVVVFPAPKFDRLNVFRNMVDRSLDSQKDERAAGKPMYFGPVTNGRIAQPYLRLDSEFRDRVNRAAFNLYYDELRHDPDMKEIADDMVAELKEQYEDPPAMTPEEARILFERTWHGGAAE